MKASEIINTQQLDENLRDWFGKEKWVRMDTKGNIKGPCARGSSSEGKPKCLPQARAHALGKKGRAAAAQKKRRQDPNPDRRGAAINVATKTKESKIYSDTTPTLQGLSFAELDRVCESAGDNFSNFDRSIKKNLNFPNWTNTLEIYGVYLRNLNEHKSGKTLDENTQTDVEQNLFNQLTQRTMGSIDSAAVGDRVSLLHLVTLNIPGHRVVARLNGFLTPKQIVNITNTGSLQQLEFSDGSRYPEKDGGDIFQQTQGWNMTKLFPSYDLASKAYAFYALTGKQLSDELDFQFDVQQGKAETELDEACWKGYHKEGNKKMFGKTYPNCVKNKNESLETYVRKGECPGCGGDMVAEDQITEKQDACYHKVKSRYKVWPSAYASGALVQCRKKGAANWGNGGAKESVEQVLIKEKQMKPTEFVKEAGMSRAAKGNEKYGKDGMAALAKAGREGASEQELDVIRDKHDNYNESYDQSEYNDEAGMVDSNLETIKRAAEELDQVLGQDDNMAEWAQEKLAVVRNMLVAVKDYVVSQKSTGIDPQVDLDEDWQKANRRDKTSGMSSKAVKAYRRENPGSKLQTAVTTKPSKLKPGSKAAKRRKSFCARMSGNKGPMKKPNGKPTPKALALRRWNCESVEDMRQLIETAERVIAEAKRT